MSINAIKIYEGYLAAKATGVTADIQTYVYSIFYGLSKKEADRLIMKLKKMITNDNDSKHPSIR